MGAKQYVRAGNGQHGITVHHTLPAPRKRARQAAHLDTVRPDPQVWATAMSLADGDARRLETQRDGSVIVHSNRIR
jgi:hypothetical protein